VNCFVFGPSDLRCLRVHYRGSFPYRWAVEEQTADGWRENSTTGLLLFPFWRWPLVEYRQNLAFDMDEPGTADDRRGAWSLSRWR